MAQLSGSANCRQRAAEGAGHDGVREPGFLTQALPFYAFGFLVAVLLRTGWQWVAWTALALGVGLILVSTFYYGPVLLPQRQPGPIDWVEDRVYTGLLFVAVALLVYDLLGKTLVPS